MPLIHGKSKAAFSHNVAAEVHSGKPVKQAVAIAYSEKRKHMNMGGYAEGGEAEMGPMQDEDHEALMDHVALECMNAIEAKDKAAFKESFGVLMADILGKMSAEHESEGE